MEQSHAVFSRTWEMVRSCTRLNSEDSLKDAQSRRPIGLSQQMSEKCFTCCECGDDVVLMNAEGRTRELLKGVHLPIPDGFMIHTCRGCEEQFSEPEAMEWLDRYLFVKHVAPVSAIFSETALEWFRSEFNRRNT